MGEQSVKKKETYGKEEGQRAYRLRRKVEKTSWACCGGGEIVRERRRRENPYPGEKKSQKRDKSRDP